MESCRFGNGGNQLSQYRTYPRLRPGPGQQIDQVASHQRLRLLHAMLDLVVDEGYELTTVRKLSQLAGVSTASFYDRFDGKDDCFLSSCSLVLDRMHSRVSAARVHHQDRRTQLTHTVEAFLAEPTADPDVARVALVDAYGGGPAAIGRMLAFETSLEAEVRSNLSRRGTIPSVAVVSWITAGCFRACRSLLTNNDDEGDDLADRLATWGMSCLEVASARRVPALPEDLLPLPVDSRDPRCFDGRDAILSAATKLAVSQGYWGLQVSDIRKQAGVSRAAFEEHFEGVDDCYLAAAAALGRSYLTGIARSIGSPRNCAARVHRAVVTLARRLFTEPKKAHFAFVGILDPGTKGLRQRERLISELGVVWQSQIITAKHRDLVSAEATLGGFWNAIARGLDASGTAVCAAPTSLLTPLLLAPTLAPSQKDEASAASEVSERAATSVPGSH